jgi:hypothetical protein
MNIPNANCEPFLGKTERDLLAGILLASGGTPASVPNTAACPEWGYGKHTVRDILGGILLAIQNGGGGGVDLSSPPPIGDVTPNTGEFTDLVAATFQGVIGNVTPAAGTFTGLTVNQGTLTDPVTGLALNATWDDAADTFRLIAGTITDTNSLAQSMLVDLQCGFMKFQVGHWVLGKFGTRLTLGSNGGDVNIQAYGNALELGAQNGNHDIVMPGFRAVRGQAGFGLQIGSSSIVSLFGGTEAGGANILQIGTNHATTPTLQTLKAHDVTTGTGAGLLLSGGTGDAGKGAVTLDGGNRSVYIASPSATEIRDILISHGLMAAS